MFIDHLIEYDGLVDLMHILGEVIRCFTHQNPLAKYNKFLDTLPHRLAVTLT